ncbi:MAG: hypothetical protein H6739_14925 [Alphaproteobacteria bacterium]|nr:hypothetical protein [Alphaproteobacteria bacterium]
MTWLTMLLASQPLAAARPAPRPTLTVTIVVDAPTATEVVVTLDEVELSSCEGEKWNLRGLGAAALTRPLVTPLPPGKWCDAAPRFAVPPQAWLPGSAEPWSVFHSSTLVDADEAAGEPEVLQVVIVTNPPQVSVR